MILNPRKCNRYDQGWNHDTVLKHVHDFTYTLQRQIANSWFSEGFVTDGDDVRLRADKIWEDDVLIPWAKKASIQLQDYKKWIASKNTLTKPIHLPNIKLNSKDPDHSCLDIHKNDLDIHLDTINPKVHQLYQNVLYYLREANNSGLWPETTPKRRLVMSSNIHPDYIAPDDKKDQNTNDKSINVSSSRRSTQNSLAMALMKAKNNKAIRESAYAFVEGEGGASGSFSIGGMPGKQCEQPKANLLFPNLVKAAFELEIALCPDREPSSTIAVNRNAQFRPHTGKSIYACIFFNEVKLVIITQCCHSSYIFIFFKNDIQKIMELVQVCTK